MAQDKGTDTMSTLSPSHYEARSSYLLPRSESEQERCVSLYVFAKTLISFRLTARTNRLDDQHKYATVVLFESRLIYDEDVILTPGNKVLDAGAGTGNFIKLIQDARLNHAQASGFKTSPSRSRPQSISSDAMCRRATSQHSIQITFTSMCPR